MASYFESRSSKTFLLDADEDVDVATSAENVTLGCATSGLNPGRYAALTSSDSGVDRLVGFANDAAFDIYHQQRPRASRGGRRWAGNASSSGGANARSRCGAGLVFDWRPSCGVVGAGSVGASGAMRWASIVQRPRAALGLLILTCVTMMTLTMTSVNVREGGGGGGIWCRSEEGKKDESSQRRLSTILRSSHIDDLSVRDPPQDSPLDPPLDPPLEPPQDPPLDQLLDPPGDVAPPSLTPHLDASGAAKRKAPAPHKFPSASQRQLFTTMDDNGVQHLVGQKRHLPQCIIIGARKCGTRALIEFLNLHPRLAAAREEVHFFDSDENYSLGLDWYRRKMPYTFPDQITLEKSPAYFIVDGVPERIFAMNSTVKLILIVRDPTTRAVSDYAQVHANRMIRRKPHDPFEDYAITKDGAVNSRYKAIRTSTYSNHLERWLKVFKTSQFHVVDGDAMIVDPLSELRRVETFLGVEHRLSYDNIYWNETRGFYCMRETSGGEKCLSGTKGRKHPNVPFDVVLKLNEYFRPYNRKFFKMIDKKFDWPRIKMPSGRDGV